MNLSDQQLTPLTEKNSQYQPTQEQLIDYAQYIGFILPDDQHLLYIAHDGLKADLPQNWQAYGNKKGDLFYKNLLTGTIQQQHPADQVVKQKFQRQKKRIQLLTAQKQVIVQQNQSDLANSDVYRMLKTSNSHRQQGKSYLKTQQLRIEQNISCQKSMQSVQSMNDQQLNQNPISANFYASLTEALEPQIVQLNNLTLRLNQKHSRKIESQISSMQLSNLKLKQITYNNQQTLKFTQQIQDLGSIIKQKQQILTRLTQQRIRKQKQIIRIQQQFQMQKQEILDDYRKRLRAKLQKQKTKKQKQFQSEYRNTLKRQYNKKEQQIRGSKYTRN